MSRFNYIKYDLQSQERQAVFKKLFEQMEAFVGELKDGRPKSLVFTKLEEAYMWVGKAIRDEQIATNGTAEQQPERTNS